MKLARLFLVIALMFLASLGLWALQLGGGYGGSRSSITGEREEPSEFYFSRLRYNSFGYRGFRGACPKPSPRADNDCLFATRRLTRINAPAPLNFVDLDSDRMFDYPWINRKSTRLNSSHQI